METDAPNINNDAQIRTMAAEKIECHEQYFLHKTSGHHKHTGRIFSF